MTILLTGACGSGKTWVFKNIIDLLKTKSAKSGLIRFRIDEVKNIAIMGVYDGTTFEGSDRLSMAIMKDINILYLLKKQKNITLLAEGDRFTNSTFIEKLQPIIIKIEDDGEIGRKKRNSTQK